MGITGINQKVKIMPLKFLGRGGFGSTEDAIEAINYAIDRKKNGVNVRIISASWGSTVRSKALEDTIRAAGDAGILFVAAAGNDGSNNDKRPHYPSNYDLPNVISVAALDRNDQLASVLEFRRENRPHRRSGQRHPLNVAERRLSRSLWYIDGDTVRFWRCGIDHRERPRDLNEKPACREFSARRTTSIH